jgi:hypothetical protein
VTGQPPAPGQPPAVRQRPAPGPRPVPGGLGLATRLAAAVPGAGMVALAATGAPGPAQVLTGAGALLVTASIAGPLRGWPGSGALAGTAAVAECALARLTSLGLAAEGLLILGYLLLLDAPDGPQRGSLLRWLRQQAPAAGWAVLACAVILVVLTVPVPVSAWLVAAGAAAVVAAAAVALPRRPGRRSGQ